MIFDEIYYDTTAEVSLDGRRPTTLDQIAGNEQVLRRLRDEIATNGTPPRRCLFVGPSGSGKTTIAQILARYSFCEQIQRRVCSRPCGVCPGCQSNNWAFVDWCGSDLSQHWDKWQDDLDHVLTQPGYTLFIDELQALQPGQLTAMLRLIERARARFCGATTHIHELPIAFRRRFGFNVYELEYPRTDTAVCYLGRLAQTLKVTVSPEQLTEVARRVGNDMRMCVDFLYTAAKQTRNGVVTPQYLADALQLESVASGAGAGPASATEAREEF